MDLKRGAAYWASSMAGLFLLLAFPALFDGIEGLRWPAFFELILKAVFYAVLGALLLASFHWQPAVTSGTVALVELIRIFSCVIFLMDTWDFSQIPVFILCIMFFIASLIFAVIPAGSALRRRAAALRASVSGADLYALQLGAARAALCRRYRKPGHVFAVCPVRPRRVHSVHSCR